MHEAATSAAAGWLFAAQGDRHHRQDDADDLVQQHEADGAADTDAQGEARGTLYEDAGDGYGYEHGMYRLTTFQVSQRAGRIAVASSFEGNWPEPVGRAVEVVLVPAPRGK